MHHQKKSINKVLEEARVKPGSTEMIKSYQKAVNTIMKSLTAKEIQEAKALATEWNEWQPPQDVQTAEKKGWKYTEEFAKEMWKHCGARVVVMAAWEDADGEESTVTDTSSNEPEQPDRGFTSGILSNLFTHSLASLGTPIPPVPATLPTLPTPPQNTMSGSSSKGMTAITGVKPTELKIGAPSDFDGDQKNAMSWLYSVQTYLLVNEELYDTDTKKVVYALLYMKKGVARSWAATYQKIALEKTNPSFGTFTDFVKNFKELFTSADTAGTAIAKLRTLKQKESVEQYITDFRTAAADSTITEDVTLIKFFSQGLKPFIVN
ncbi:hypothetical protein M404DRAFT_25506 [Pisolithus tinctorius Marx 270]|uniref:Retrotransposon gag domain-containing protein n=1 Tax=Pisolithus tinctorius Marx 270 TaxID=870435 RepID=A0A0C3NWZ3_PISTI|nr:hypothetical protein M404DRAFT_25506 [Pisolithus tinctorius Marx 270]